MKQAATTIDLLRHGETEGGEIFRGSTDVPLTQQGWQQMQKSLHDEKSWQRIISSPLCRCADFAAWLSQTHGIVQQQEAALREISFGDWDGRSVADVEKDHGELLRQFWQNPLQYTPPGAEPMTEFVGRVKAALWQQITNHQGQHLLLVTHGGVIRAILADILGSEMTSLMRFEVPWASFSRIRIYHDGEQHWPQLVFFNR